MDDATRLLQATLTEAKQGEPMHSGPVFAAPFHAMGDASQVPYTYARAHNPTWTELESALSGLEGGGAPGIQSFVFPSGMAAIASIFGTVLRPGDVAVLPSNAYYVARKLMQEYFVEMGVTLRLAPTANNAQAALLDGAKLLWLETPSNPTMEVCDIAKLCELAHAKGALVAVDNSTPTALSQKPLLLGADFSVASDAKSMSGHSDILYGHVAVKDPALATKIVAWRRLMGPALGPMEAWLALRSLSTLPLRLERASANAMKIAEFLKTRGDVTNLLYPGLKSHPDHALAAKQMRYFGPVVSFTLPSETKANEFLTRAKLITQATSFGSVVTTAERRARWGGDDVAPGFIRLSAGCEAIDDLLADIAQALDAVKIKLAEFIKNWGAEILREPPMIAPARQFVYPQFVPGEEDAMARGALLLMVRPVDGAPFLATCARGFADVKTPTEVFACPNPDEMCAVAGGYAYIVDVREPSRCDFLALRPVVSIMPLVEHGLLLFSGFHAVMAWGAGGFAWQTGKLSDEGLRIESAENGVLRGFGWKLMTDKEVPFAIDLATGKLIR